MRSAWEYFAFLANSFVFILIGMNVANQPLQLARLGGRGRRDRPGARRAGPCRFIRSRLLFSRSRWRLPASYQHTLFWGGLRGALGAGASAGRSGDRARARRDHPHRLRRRRLLDPRPGTDDAVADQAPEPRRRSRDGGGCRSGGCWLGAPGEPAPRTASNSRHSGLSGLPALADDDRRRWRWSSSSAGRSTTSPARRWA